MAELAVMAGTGLHTVWQPVVDLTTMRPVGAEALARGPAGTPWHRPDVLFARARELGQVAQLCASCRRTALRAAIASQVTGPATLFLNAEPEGLGPLFDGYETELAELAPRGVRLVLEITERDLTSHPAELLAAVTRVRAQGWAIALDDVGAQRESLALLPVLAPDVIKLDLALVQQRTTTEVAETVNAVLAHAERTGATVLAEGIETTEHLQLARAMGATLGQGWLLGRPGPLDLDLCQGLSLRPQAHQDVPATPWDLMAGSALVRRATKPLLTAMSLILERQALDGGQSCLLLGTLQHDRYLTPVTLRRYARVAEQAAYVAVLGVGITEQPAPGVRGVDLTPGSALTHEWDVVVVGPHFAAALVARQVHLLRDDATREEDREFDYALTYDRDTVLAAARSLMAHITPDPAGPAASRDPAT